MVRAECVFVAGIHPSRTWTSGSFESVRWNACVLRLDLGLYSHPKEFFWGMEFEPMITPRENPLYRRRIEPVTLWTASPSTTNWAIPAPKLRSGEIVKILNCVFQCDHRHHYLTNCTSSCFLVTPSLERRSRSLKLVYHCDSYVTKNKSMLKVCHIKSPK